MNKIQKIKNFRQFLLRQIDGLSTEQLNLIPAGYNNNIIWNVAHLLSAQQSLCYVRAELPITVEDRFFSPFLPTTRPEQFVPEPDIATIKQLFISTIDQLQADVDDRIFTSYTPSERIASVYGVEVSSIDDALDFLLFHEGFHTGYVMAMKHLV